MQSTISDQTSDNSPQSFSGKTSPEFSTRKTMLSDVFWESLPVKQVRSHRQGGAWSNAGCVYGPKRTVAWRVLDAQFFGVAQRRRRVFVVASARDGFDPTEVLFEFEGVRRDTAPSREAGQEVAGTIAARFGISRNNHEECVTWPAQLAPTLNASFGNKQGLENQHINSGGGCLPSVAKCLITKTRLDAETETLIPTFGGHFSFDPIALAENTIGRQPQNGGNGDGFTVGGPMYTLNATGVHGVAHSIPLDLRNAGRDPEKYDEINRQGVGVGKPGDPAHTLTSACVHGVATYSTPAIGNIREDYLASTMTKNTGAGGETQNPAYVLQPIACEVADTLMVGANQMKGFIGDVVAQPYSIMPMNSGKDYKARETDVAQPLMAGGPVGGNQGGDFIVQPIAFQLNGDRDNPSVSVSEGRAFCLPANPMSDRGQAVAYSFDSLSSNPMKSSNPDSGVNQVEVSKTLDTSRGLDSSCNQGSLGLVQSMAVRRLTPTECERLQGFPDGYTNIPWRKKEESPDGPRYKALGNSWAVPNVRWIGQRIQHCIDNPMTTLPWWGLI